MNRSHLSIISMSCVQLILAVGIVYSQQQFCEQGCHVITMMYADGKAYEYGDGGVLWGGRAWQTAFAPMVDGGTAEANDKLLRHTYDIGEKMCNNAGNSPQVGMGSGTVTGPVWDGGLTQCNLH